MIWVPLLKCKALNISSVFVPLLKIQIYRRDPKVWPNLTNMPVSRKGVSFWSQFHAYIQRVRDKFSKGNSTLGNKSKSWVARKQQMSTTLRIINDAAFPTFCKYYIMCHRWYCYIKSNALNTIIIYSLWILSSIISCYRPSMCDWPSNHVVTSEQHFIPIHNYTFKKLKA